MQAALNVMHKLVQDLVRLFPIRRGCSECIRYAHRFLIHGDVE